MIYGRLDQLDQQAVDEARRQTWEQLTALLPQFEWRMPHVRLEAVHEGSQVEPAELLEAGVSQRNARHWDYTVIVTGADLMSHYRNEARACISRSLESVVISTRRLDPRAEDLDTSADQRGTVIQRRIVALVMHALGHEAGLSHTDEDGNYMVPFADLEEIDRAREFSSSQLETLKVQFAEVADRRLEETADYHHSRPLPFYLRSAWLNRREIAAAVVEASPWQFPYRLSRLTTAAISAVLVLLLTAEAWELASHQSVGLLLGLSLSAAVGTTIYVCLRQRIFISRRQARLSEQTVSTNCSTVAIVFLGILTTYLCLFLVGMLIGWVFFSREVVQHWTNIDRWARFLAPLKPAMFAASLALFIGALGVTFENIAYFRHVTFVDEEI